MSSRLMVRRGRRSRLLLAGAAVLAAGSLGPATALGSGADLYAAPGAAAGGSCAQASPCELAYAVFQAAAGDTVVVAPGTYDLAGGLSIAKPITVQGEGGQPRPSLVGTVTRRDAVIEASGGATLDGLDIQAGDSTVRTTALTVDGATAQDLTVSIAAGDAQGVALSVRDSAAGTLVRTVLALSAAPGGRAVSFADSTAGAGTATVLDLTAVATGPDSQAVFGDVAAGAVTISNAIAYGPGYEVSTQPGTSPLEVDHSDFTTAAPGAVAAGPGNISAIPLFADGAYREAAGSPTIGTGTSDPSMTEADLDGQAWPASGPDMGAYEFTGTGTGGTGPGAGGPGRIHRRALPPAARPVAGRSVTVSAGSGTVTVRLPGTHRFVALDQPAELPVGAVLDASHGRVRLTSAISSGGATRTGTFTGGRFAVTQTRSARPLTELRLVGGSFAGCGARSPADQTRIASDELHIFMRAGRHHHRPRHHRVVRHLWGSDHGGRFVTIGRTASAAVRGTVWLTEDRCDGTLVRVLRGRVLVHDHRRHRTVSVRAGHSYLARAPS